MDFTHSLARAASSLLLKEVDVGSTLREEAESDSDRSMAEFTDDAMPSLHPPVTLYLGSMTPAASWELVLPVLPRNAVTCYTCGFLKFARRRTMQSECVFAWRVGPALSVSGVVYAAFV